MSRDKLSTKKPTNLAVLLQDIRNCLGEDYVFDEQCGLAIIRVTRRHEDASAWYEQLQQLVNGNDRLAYSHAGVLLLLGTLGEGVYFAFVAPRSHHGNNVIF